MNQFYSNIYQLQNYFLKSLLHVIIDKIYNSQGDDSKSYRR
jgi:hypothetical protein